MSTSPSRRPLAGAAAASLEPSSDRSPERHELVLEHHLHLGSRMRSPSPEQRPARAIAPQPPFDPRKPSTSIRRRLRHSGRSSLETDNRIVAPLSSPISSFLLISLSLSQLLSLSPLQPARHGHCQKLRYIGPAVAPRSGPRRTPTARSGPPRRPRRPLALLPGVQRQPPGASSARRRRAVVPASRVDRSEGDPTANRRPASTASAQIHGPKSPKAPTTASSSRALAHEFRKRSDCEDSFDYVGSSFSGIRSSSKRNLRQDDHFRGYHYYHCHASCLVSIAVTLPTTCLTSLPNAMKRL